MNKEILVKLNEAKSAADVEKESIDNLYAKIWDCIIEEYKTHLLNASTKDYYSKPLKACIDPHMINDQLTTEGFSVLRKKLEEDGFKFTQLAYQIIWEITPEQVDEIISSVEKSSDMKR